MIASRRRLLSAGAALLAFAVAGCAYRQYGTVRGPFSHGEAGETVRLLPDPPQDPVLHWDRSELDRGRLTLEYATPHERVVLYRRAWFHEVEVVRKRSVWFLWPPLFAGAAICLVTVVLSPIGLLMLGYALIPTYDPPFGRVVPGEYSLRENARVVERVYRPVPPPPGAAMTVRVAPSEDTGLPSRTWQELALGNDGRAQVDISAQARRAAAGGVGLTVIAEWQGRDGPPPAVLELGPGEVRDIVGGER